MKSKKDPPAGLGSKIVVWLVFLLAAISVSIWAFVPLVSM